MTCAYCGAHLSAGAMMCGECGRSVAVGQSASSSPKPRASADDIPPALPEPLVEPTLTEPVFTDPGVLSTSAFTVDPIAVVSAAESGADDVGPDVVQPSLDAGSFSEVSLERCSQCGAALEPSDIFCGECGFVRHPVVRVPARPHDTVGYDPFPWGLPRSEAAVRVDRVTEPSPELPAATPTIDATPDDFDETRIVDRASAGERFVLQFSTGESVSVTGTGLLGRNPVAEPGEFFDAIVAISDPGKSVSKTHLEFGQESGAFWVSDRYSGNGTIVREPERQQRRCDPGKRYRIIRGTRVDIGEQFFIVS